MEISQIKQEIDKAPHGMKAGIIDKYCRLLGRDKPLSKSELYRKIRKQFGARKKIIGKNKIDNHLIDKVAKLKVEGMNMTDKERELSTEECINILKDNGVPGADKLTVSTVNRRLRERGMRTRDKIVRIEAERPNQTHQLDFSRSKYFQVHRYDAEKGDYILKVSNRVLSYKQNENRLRTWLVGLIDTYSRIPLVMAFAAAGESASIGIEFLNYAYRRPEDDNPVRYLPETLKTDNGALIKNKAFQNMLKALDIRSETVIPYKHRGIQKIEALWRTLWYKFELPLALQLEVGTEISLSDYNEALHAKIIELAEQEHPRRKGSKIHIYKSALAKYPPRTVNADLNDIAFRVIERKVNQACQVSIDKNLYEVPLFAIDKRIRIYKNENGDFVGELIDEFRKPFKLTPTSGFVNEGDFSHRAPATYREQIEKQLDKSEKREEKQASNKIKYMPAKPVEQLPDTPFHAEHRDFSNWDEAKVYLGRKMLAEGLDIFKYVDHLNAIHVELGESLLNKNELDSIIEYLKNQKAVNQ